MVDCVKPLVSDDQIVEEGNRVAVRDLLTDDECSGLLLPAKRQLIGLITRDEDRVTEEVVD